MVQPGLYVQVVQVRELNFSGDPNPESFMCTLRMQYKLYASGIINKAGAREAILVTFHNTVIGLFEPLRISTVIICLF